MHISGVISALHELFVQHGDIPVHPKGDGKSVAHSVHYADGHAVISDSFIDSIFGALDFFSSDLSPSNMSPLAGGRGSINDVIADLRQLRGMHGDVSVVPKGSGGIPVHAVYFFEGSVYLSEDAWDALGAAIDARIIATYRNAQAGFVTYNVSERVSG